MRTLSIALVLLMQIACTTTDLTFSYEGEKVLTQKKIDRKFRKDEAYCRLDAQKATATGYGNYMNLAHANDLQNNFVDCMITRDWELDPI